MAKLIKLLLVFALLFVNISPLTVFAKSGCCSSHGGVCCNCGAQSNGKVICNDGWRGSSCLYSGMVKCGGSSFNNSRYSLPTPKPTQIPTFPPTATPKPFPTATPRPLPTNTPKPQVLGKADNNDSSDGFWLKAGGILLIGYLFGKGVKKIKSIKAI